MRRESRVLDLKCARAAELEARGGPGLRPRRVERQALTTEETVAERFTGERARSSLPDHDAGRVPVVAQCLAEVPEEERPPPLGGIELVVPIGAVAETGMDQAKSGAAGLGGERPLDHHAARKA